MALPWWFLCGFAVGVFVWLCRGGFCEALPWGFLCGFAVVVLCGFAVGVFVRLCRGGFCVALRVVLAGFG